MERLWSGLSAALRAPRSANDEALVASLGADEWSALVDMAVRQGVSPQLHATSLPPLPRPVADRLRDTVEAINGKTRRYQEAFQEIAAAVEADGIPIVALKGMHLSLAAYPPAMARQMADLDVLVRRDDLTRVAAAANRLGFTADPKRLNRNPHHLPVLSRSGLSLEIHWRLADAGEPPAAPPEDLWRRVRWLPVARNAFTLAPEDALIHVCAHAAYSHHFEQGLRPLYDVRALLAAHAATLDWHAVTSRARAWNCGRCVALALSLARDLLGAAVPLHALEGLGGEPPSPVMTTSVRQIFGPRTAMHTVGGAAGQALTGSPRQRLRFMRRSLVLPREQIQALYPGRSPDSVGVIARVVARRLVVLVKRYGWLLMRTAARPDSAERGHVTQRHLLREWLDGRGASA